MQSFRRHSTTHQLWTIQPVAVWETLQSNDALRTTSALREWKSVYGNPIDPSAWLTEQMKLRLEESPAPGTIPWWAWYAWSGQSRRRPDLRAVRWWHPKGEKCVRIELEIEQSRVLLSDYDAWHAVLNGDVLSHSERERLDFERRLEREGVEYRGKMVVEPFRSEIVESWQRIFDLTGGDPAWRGKPDERSIQATFSEMRLCDVKTAHPSAARPTAKRDSFQSCPELSRNHSGDASLLSTRFIGLGEIKYGLSQPY